MLLPQQPSVYLYNYILLPYNHAATPTTKSLPLQLHTATLQPCCYTPTTKSLPLQLHTATIQPCCYPNNQVPTLLLPYNHADTPTTKSLPLQLHTAIPYNHADTPTTNCKSLPLQLYILIYYNHAVTPTTKSLPLQHTYCYPTTMLLPQQPIASPYPYNYTY